MWEQVEWILLSVGVVGFVVQCVRFVRVTLPENFGSNPGFGALEVMVAPWLIIGSVGLGLVLDSWKWGGIVFGLGMFSTGLLAMLLGRLFGGR